MTTYAPSTSEELDLLLGESVTAA
ncbi:MAG: hypothetical protein QOC98_2454, partial [Frankiaceae bacterium]|nr:hypothetical protein [Frankiaceae bacterium]